MGCNLATKRSLPPPPQGRTPQETEWFRRVSQYVTSLGEYPLDPESDIDWRDVGRGDNPELLVFYGGRSPQRVALSTFTALGLISQDETDWRTYLDVPSSSEIITSHNNLTGFDGGSSSFRGHLSSGELASVQGLGTIASQNSSNVNLTGGTVNVGNVYVANAPTTAAAANAVIDTGSSPVNQLKISTSSKRFKTDIEDLPDSVALNVLALRPVSYRSLSSADDPVMKWYGLIAEEVAQVDPRLVVWKDGEPYAIQYDRLAVVLLKCVQALAANLGELMERADREQ